MTFQDFVIRCFDRMDMALPTAVTETNYRVIDAKIRLLDGATVFFHDDKYLENRKLIEEKLKLISPKDFKYYKTLMSWVKLIARRFQFMDIIGPVPAGIVMGSTEGPKPLHGEFAHDQPTKTKKHKIEPNIFTSLD